MGLKEARDDIRLIDEQMAHLFVRRMEAVRAIAEHKRIEGLPVEDAAQEARVMEHCCACIEDAQLRPYYESFLQATMDISKNWQRHLIAESETFAGEGRAEHPAVATITCDEAAKCDTD